MAGWSRVVRAALGTALTFAVGVGAATSVVGVVAMVFGTATWISVARTAGRNSVVAFLLGLGFSGLLALASRRGWLQRLTFPRVAVLGATAGLAYYGFIALNAWAVWTPRAAVGNLVALLGIGAGAASGTLLLARRGRAELGRGDDARLLDEPR
jgi:hypothetical protein